MFGRVDPFESVDARLRSVAQSMLECQSLPEMRRLEWERDKLLDQRIELERGKLPA